MTAPTFDPGPCEGLTPFQQDHIRSIAALPEFSHFVLLDGDVAKTFMRESPGPKNVLWYDNKGSLWLDRIGQRELLSRLGSNDIV